MIREIKKQARLILSKNYKLFLLPTILCLFSGVATYCSFYLFYNSDSVFKINSPLKYVCLGVYLIFLLCVTPVFDFLIVKTAVSQVSEQTDSDKFADTSIKVKDVLKIILISLIPALLKAVRALLGGLAMTSINFALIRLFVDGYGIYLSYKFFACDYFFALKRTTVKDAFRFSFKTMNKKFLKYSLMIWSFALWYLAILILTLLFSTISNLSDFYRNLLTTVGYGIRLYLIPYEYITYILFVKKIHTEQV